MNEESRRSARKKARLKIGVVVGHKSHSTRCSSHTNLSNQRPTQIIIMASESQVTAPNLSTAPRCLLCVNLIAAAEPRRPDACLLSSSCECSTPSYITMTRARPQRKRPCNASALTLARPSRAPCSQLLSVNSATTSRYVNSTPSPCVPPASASVPVHLCARVQLPSRLCVVVDSSLAFSCDVLYLCACLDLSVSLFLNPRSRYLC